MEKNGYMYVCIYLVSKCCNFSIFFGGLLLLLLSSSCCGSCCSVLGLVVERSLEQEDVWFRRMALVVLPPERLCDPEPSPLVFRQDTQRPDLAVEVVRGYHLQHRLGQHYVSVLVHIVAVPRRVVNRLLKLQHARTLLVSKLPSFKSMVMSIHICTYPFECPVINSTNKRRRFEVEVFCF